MPTAIASSNIAFVKYWGNLNDRLRLPASPSLSMNLAGLETRTTVEFDPALPQDQLTIDGVPQAGAARERIARFLDLVRAQAGRADFARVISANNFPAGAGIASSASAFAAISLAASAAVGLHLSEAELSALARRGSGSAARSIPAGFVAWQPGDDQSSFAVCIAPPAHWDLADVVAVISKSHKAVGSTGGHALAPTSPLQNARLAGAGQRFEQCQAAILNRDFEALAAVAEADSDLMHAVMQTSRPPLLYWEPRTVAIIKAVRAWRADGLPVCYTIDAGPNVHCLCPADRAPEVAHRLRAEIGVAETLTARPGPGARLV